MTRTKRSKLFAVPRTYTYIGRYSEQFREECKWAAQYLECTQIETIEQAMHEMVQRLKSYSIVMDLGAGTQEKEE